MAKLPLDQAVIRFQSNDERIDRFANGNESIGYNTSSGVFVPSIQKFLSNKNVEINVGAESILADATAAKDAAELSATEAAATVASLSASSGASLVGYLPAGTGVIASTVQGKLRESVSVKDFGVLGNGTDETTKLQAALNHLNTIGGGTLHINGEIIRCDGPIVGYTKTKIVGDQGSTIDFSHRTVPYNTASTSLFTFRGSASAEILLTDDATIDNNIVYVSGTDASAFTVGSLVEISMNAAGSFNDPSIAVKTGQLNIVTSVSLASGSRLKLVLDTPIFDTLPVASGARLRKITPVEDITIEGVTFTGPGRYAVSDGDTGLGIYHGKNVTVRNCKFVRIDLRAVEVIGCRGFMIDNCDVYQDPHGTNGNVDSISYGIVYSSSMNGVISNNRIINSRHGIVSSHISSGAVNKYYGVSRFISVDANTVTGNYGDLSGSGFPMSHGGIATHTDAEFISITNNTVSGCRHGVNARFRNVLVKGNTLTGNQFGVYLSSFYRDITIDGNLLSGNANAGNTIYSDSSSNPDEIRSGLVVINNRFNNTSKLTITCSTTVPSAGLQIANNIFTGYNGSVVTTNGMITIDGKFSGEISGNIIKLEKVSIIGVPTALLQGIAVRNAKSLQITGNNIDSTTNCVGLYSTSSNLYVSGNIYSNSGGVSNASVKSCVMGNINLGDF